ncbi:hypothetical protein MSG28_013071 [Choristoneura fumiferana]|uniref:Uncharacterized protein n=1 Tax=Choristoneura fumiferana TaxID=7141 RepID=A0ACC0KSD9_CHOFU|nr:hypothetical protein MSG28_013071 [Choristoneura fumiferana]
MAAQWEIKGKTCLITGGASGLGALYVESYLREGAKFVAMLDIAEGKGKALAAKLNETYPGKVEFVKCDVSKEDSVTAAFNAVVSKVKQLDIIINNAGIMNDSENIWRTACDVNWQGLVSLTLKGVKHMRKDEGGAGGTVINVSSIAAFLVAPQLPIYHGSKAAVMHFSRCLAIDPFHAKTGVRVLTICFGATDTPLLQGIPERVIDPMHVISSVLGRQRPESAAAACVTMFKNGANGSVWLSQNDAPAQDITDTIAKAYDLMNSVLVLS